MKRKKKKKSIKMKKRKFAINHFTNFNIIPDVLLLQILLYLDGKEFVEMRIVCKRFNAIVSGRGIDICLQLAIKKRDKREKYILAKSLHIHSAFCIWCEQKERLPYGKCSGDYCQANGITNKCICNDLTQCNQCGSKYCDDCGSNCLRKCGVCGKAGICVDCRYNSWSSCEDCYSYMCTSCISPSNKQCKHCFNSL